MIDPPQGVPGLSAIELAERLSRGEAFLLLDVREPRERAYCSIVVPPGADLFVPLGKLPSRSEEVRTAADWRPLAVYCHHGVRSRMAAEWLLEQGLKAVFNLEGGIDAWSRCVDQTVLRY